jgi:hypothetical protein
MASTGIYESNQFAYRKPTRNQTMAAAPRKVKGHFPIWINIAILIVVVGAAGAVGYKLTHPSVHHSPVAIATDFAQKVSAGQYKAAMADVDPADQAKALSYMEQQSGVSNGAFADVHSTKLSSQQINGTSASVVIQACNQSFACNALPPIPCIQIKGSWYVNWIPFLNSAASN